MPDAMPLPLLGIMVTELPGELPFAHSNSFQELCLLGLRENIEVFVFSPNRIDWDHELITGYTFLSNVKEWVKRVYPLPNLIYDRCFFTTRSDYGHYRMHMQKLRSRSTIRFLGHGLSGKYEVAQILGRDAFIHPYIPETCLLSHVGEALDWLELKGEVFLKPQGGSQGKGVLYVRRQPEGYHLSGRDRRNRPFRIQVNAAADLKDWLRRFIGRRHYLIQPYLNLKTEDGIAYDIRSMAQKNGHCRWELTGMGVRCGLPGSITSNLHGGGSAAEVYPFLVREFGANKADELMGILTELSAKIPPALEAVHGQLVELGIDLGIDRSSRIWILEVNSKPGRTLFNHLSNETARRKSKENPIRYAAYLLRAQRINRLGAGTFPNLSGAESLQRQQV